jgi:4-amino-4-deoxy-L-arabinose transferase-like glycosyltransferase
MDASRTYRLVWLLAGVVLLCGLLFPPLMDFDAAQIGTISMRMFLTGDWMNLVNRHYVGGAFYDYLDKPHLVYWSAVAGYHLFGLGVVGMRFFSVLSTLAAAYATARIGERLYNRKVGGWAALMFVTSQSILLANHDVRTDSLLTAFTVLAVWQLLVYIDERRWPPLIAGFLFLAFGVASKGLISVLAAGFALSFFLIARRDWSGLFNRRWPAGILVFFIGLSPFLYAYYLQFDMHPEKLVNGSHGNSGVKFLLWSHSFDRFAGNRELVASPEFGFFLHTILWVFLPWSLLMVTGVYDRLRELVRTRGGSFFDREQLTFAGVWSLFIVMSFSSFKLPHYLNILLPLMSVFTAGWVWRLHAEGRTGYLGRLFVVQKSLVILLLVGLSVIATWFFPLSKWWVIVGVVPFVYLLYRIWKGEGLGLHDRTVFLSAVGVLLVNFVLNAHFYPELGRYQAGNRMADIIQSRGIDTSSVYYYGGRVSRSFDFYSRRFAPYLDSSGIAERLSAGREVHLYTSGGSGDTLRRQFPLAVVVDSVPDQRVTRLKLSFLNPATREKGLPRAVLYRVGPEVVRKP